MEILQHCNKNADVVLYGHLHNQYMQTFYNKTLINVGSVGNPTDVIRDENFDSNPLETVQAHYCIIEGELDKKEYNSSFSVQFVKVTYDIEKELELAKQKGIIEFEQYEPEMRRGLCRKMKSLKEILDV